MTQIAIVGAGVMGSATAWPLRDNGHDVRLVGTHLDRDIILSCKEQHFHPRLKRRLPEGMRPYFVEEIAQALEGVEIIVSGVNSLGVHWIAKTLGPHLRPGQIIISVTKGLEATETGELKIFPDVLRDELPADRRDQVTQAAIGGPCIAGELAGQRQSCVVFGSPNGAVLERLAATFRTSYYHVWKTTDLRSLEICAAFKNAYTLGVGLAAGWLEKSGGVDPAEAYMHNLAAAIFGQGCTEMARWLEIAGGTQSFAYGLPGAGDYYVTAQGGRTLRLGRLLGLGKSYAEARQILAGETLEAAEVILQVAKALPALTAQGVVTPQEFPLLRLLIEVIEQGFKGDFRLDEFFPGMNIMR
jgi:glycerol-3-phosphate dehydrogenase (NAD(P)+)